MTELVDDSLLFVRFKVTHQSIYIRGADNVLILYVGIGYVSGSVCLVNS